MNLDELMKRVLLLDRDINQRTSSLATTVENWKRVRTGWYKAEHGLLPQVVNAYGQRELIAGTRLIDASTQLRTFCSHNDLQCNPAQAQLRNGYHVSSELMHNLDVLSTLAAKSSALELQTAILNCKTYFETMKAGAVPHAVS